MASKKNDEVAAAIRAQNKALGAAIGSGDGKAAAATYTKSAKLLPPNASTQKGHAAIERYLRGAHEMGVHHASLRTSELEVHGTTATEIGTYTFKDAKGKKLDNGKYVVVWKKERGTWRLHWDIFNSNNPA